VLRRALHLILLLIIFGFIIGALRSSLPHLPAKAALVIQPVGQIVEQRSGDPLEIAFNEARGQRQTETLLRDLVDAIRAAAEDDKVQALVLDLNGMSGGGQPTLQEFASAITEFRKSGKKVIAHSVAFTQAPYFVAAHADEIYVDPLGFVLIEGYDRYRMYYKAALDKLGVDMNVYRVGAYKSAVEPYVRQDMSAEDREESSAYLNALWSNYQTVVTKARCVAGERRRRLRRQYRHDRQRGEGQRRPGRARREVDHRHQVLDRHRSARRRPRGRRRSDGFVQRDFPDRLSARRARGREAAF
jgi:protease-4